VNWSAGDVADVPPAVVTVTSTVPVPAGDVAVIEVAELTVKVVALVAPNFTAVAPVRLVPVMATDVPPVVGPAVGEIDVTVGGATWVNWSAADVADVPPGVVTVTSTVPVPAGDVAVIEVAELTVNVVVLSPDLQRFPAQYCGNRKQGSQRASDGGGVMGQQPVLGQIMPFAVWWPTTASPLTASSRRSPDRLRDDA
jgi:hypothetical protein